jgi:putative transposase
MNCRSDVQNKLALDLVRRFDVICIEDLNLRGMAKNHSLARALSDAAIGNCVRKLEEKAAMHGKKVIRIDRFFPSTKTCSECGRIQGEMPLSVRKWTCPECGAVHDRDEVTVHGSG